MNQGEIIIYQDSDNSSFQIEVIIEDETVWLTQAQMAELFQTTRNNVTIHISNIFKENELELNSVCKESLHTAQDGKKYKTNFYNLDVIISVGYRVKSKRGTQFRIWANSILKDYLLKGYAINHRIDKLEKKIVEHENKFDLLIKTNLTPNEGIFYDGQIFDAYSFVSRIIKSAHQSIVLIDNYIDETVLTLLSKRSQGVSVIIYTQKITEQFSLDLIKYNKQYEPIKVVEFNKAHDRFIILDHKIIYHIGASLKDLGRKWFAFSKIAIDAEEILNKLTKKEF